MVAAHITAELLIVEKTDIIFAETAVKAQAVDADKKVEAIAQLCHSERIKNLANLFDLDFILFRISNNTKFTGGLVSPPYILLRNDVTYFQYCHCER